jgi:D-threo-aldose 1-dehydrogenase
MLTAHPTPPALPLGFGCAQLEYSCRSRQSSLRLLEKAFEQGITHFDVARLYSAGEAEGVLGEFARRRRDRVVLVSKAGIFPLRQTYYHRANRKIRSVIKGSVPALNGWIADAAQEPIFNKFSQKDIRASVEKSLRELKTDYLDALLLHECRAADIEPLDVPATLDKLRSEGKILSYGLATSVEQSAAIIHSFPTLAPIVQIAGENLDAEKWPFLSKTNGRLIITHSVLAKSLESMIGGLKERHNIRETIQSKLGFDLSEPAGVAQFLLACAVNANSNGVVLFSTSKINNIQLCVDAVRIAKNPDNQTRLDECVRLIEMVRSYNDGSIR